MGSERNEFDLLIIGSGIAGLNAAIAASANGLSVAVISKEEALLECNTRCAQGGIVGRADEDTPELLEQDIMYAGDNINSLEAVRLLIREGPDLVEEFLSKKLNVPFSRNSDNKFDLTNEAAHSIRRIYHVLDKTGEAIETELLHHIEGVEELKTFTSCTAVDLITNTHNSANPQDRYSKTRVMGAYVLDGDTGKVSIFFAPTVILATGGVGNLFLHTSNIPGATGDGIAMAYRIGAEILHAEYVQFHPTLLFHRDMKRFLISESLRGEGARLINRREEYFMEKYDKQRKDLAPRDEVARAIYREMVNEDSEYVRLSTRGIKGISIERRFPKIFHTCRSVGIDIRKEPIPVVPAAHYFCGGIKVNLSGETSISGLYAIGETSCTGIHGANRLASISLLEGMLWGRRAGEEILKKRTRLPAKLKKNIPDWIYPRSEKVFDPVLVHQDMKTIRSTMWHYAGIIRSRNRLLRAMADLDYFSHRVEQFYREAKLTRRIVELRNSVLTSSLIVRAALINTTSTGCHYIE